MDKKKVIELIKQTISELSATGMGIICTQSTLESALEELQKPDWISVEDGLPPIGEEVWVTSKEFPVSVYKCRRVEGFIVPKDRHDFIILWEGRTTPITHWRKIDKLEV